MFCGAHSSLPWGAGGIFGEVGGVNWSCGGGSQANHWLSLLDRLWALPLAGIFLPWVWFLASVSAPPAAFTWLPTMDTSHPNTYLALGVPVLSWVSLLL